MLTYVALAHMQPHDTSRCYATHVSCTGTHLGVTQVMFLALAHISVSRNSFFFHWHTSRCYANRFLALAHISVSRNSFFLHLHISRCYATHVSCTCTHLGVTQFLHLYTSNLGVTQLMFVALAHMSVLRNSCFLHLHTSRCYATDVCCTCTHVGVTQVMFLALAHISVLRN